MSQQPKRHDRLIEEEIHDPYKSREKLADLLVCPTCGAVYHKGRWEWRDHRPSGAEDHTCPACRRIHDHCPAGILVLKGAYATDHEEGIRELLKNEALDEAKEHPLNRIIEWSSGKAEISISTTEIHLVRRLGDALHRAHHGELSFHYEPGEYFLRIHWVR